MKKEEETNHLNTKPFSSGVGLFCQQGCKLIWGVGEQSGWLFYLFSGQLPEKQGTRPFVSTVVLQVNGQISGWALSRTCQQTAGLCHQGPQFLISKPGNSSTRRTPEAPILQSEICHPPPFIINNSYTVFGAEHWMGPKAPFCLQKYSFHKQAIHIITKDLRGPWLAISSASKQWSL